MESNPKGCGRVYRILSSSPTWRSEFGHVRRRAVLRDLEELGGRGSWGNHVDIWSPSDVRGNGVPLMSADVGEGEVPGHHGAAEQAMGHHVPQGHVALAAFCPAR